MVIALHLATNSTRGFHTDALYYIDCGNHAARLSAHHSITGPPGHGPAWDHPLESSTSSNAVVVCLQADSCAYPATGMPPSGYTRS
jgi:hypothetical protein